MTVRSGPLWLRYCEPGQFGPASQVDQPGQVQFESGRSNQRRVAYALNKGLGSAVVRNRLRRQLRAVFEECAGGAVAGGADSGGADSGGAVAGGADSGSADPGSATSDFFPAGDYLVGIWPSPDAKGTTAAERKRIHNWSYGELSEYVRRALGKLERKAAHGRAASGKAGRDTGARGTAGRDMAGRNATRRGNGEQIT